MDEVSQWYDIALLNAILLLMSSLMCFGICAWIRIPMWRSWSLLGIGFLLRSSATFWIVYLGPSAQQQGCSLLATLFLLCGVLSTARMIKKHSARKVNGTGLDELRAMVRRTFR